MILTSFRGLLGLTPRRIPAGRGAVPRRRLRPNADRLEGRSLLTAFTATTVTDLVADINAANLQGGSNTITLVAPTSSPYVLTAVDNVTDGATGLPVIAAGDNLTIVGNGDLIARSAAPGTPAFRLFDVAAGASLTLRNLTLQGGLASGAGVSAEGGAVYSQGTLDLDGAIVRNNTAQGVLSRTTLDGESASGGGIYSGAALTLEGGSRIQNNQALGGEGAPGGSRGRFDFNNGFSGGAGTGGGVYVSAGTLTVSRGSLSANTAQGGLGGRGRSWGRNGGEGGTGAGGGLFVANGLVSLTDASLLANISQGGRGGDAGLYVSAGRGGQGGHGAGGGVFVNAGTLTLRYDTVMTNSALGGSGGPGSGSGGDAAGGGVYVSAGTLTLCYDTVMTNSALGGSGGPDSSGGDGGDGGNAAGGGVYVNAGMLTLRYDTVMTNSALGGSRGPDSTGGSRPGLGIGGGLFIDPAAVVCLDASTQAHVRKNRASTSDRNIHGPWTPC